MSWVLWLLLSWGQLPATAEQAPDFGQYFQRAEGLQRKASSSSGSRRWWYLGEAALVYYYEYKEKAPSPIAAEAAFRHGKVLSELGRSGEARGAFLSALELTSDSQHRAATLLELAHLARRNQNWFEARTRYQQVVALPQIGAAIQASAWEWLAKSQFQLGEPANAEAAAEAWELSSSSPAAFIRARDFRARCLIAQGELRQARRLLLELRRQILPHLLPTTSQGRQLFRALDRLQSASELRELEWSAAARHGKHDRSRKRVGMTQTYPKFDYTRLLRKFRGASTYEQLRGSFAVRDNFEVRESDPAGPASANRLHGGLFRRHARGQVNSWLTAALHLFPFGCGEHAFAQAGATALQAGLKPRDIDQIDAQTWDGCREGHAHPGENIRLVAWCGQVAEAERAPVWPLRHNRGRSMATIILEGLNEAQHEAVVHSDGPLLILAGAGTGKTRTITRRVAHLVSHQAVPSARLLAITFTNKAAREMRTRIGEWIPDRGMWVGTFHATCARMLRMDAEVVGRSRSFSIMDVDDRRRQLRQLIKDQGWDPSVYRPRRIEQFISNWKQQSTTPDGALEQASLYGMEEERAALIYAKYEVALEKQDALDFDDLLLKGLQLVQRDAKGARRWADRFEHVLVDEYQDTNDLQYRFVKQLAEAYGNLAVCGDPDQSIYRWRGADIGNILRFEDDFPGTRVIRLEKNYRSVGNVLRAAQHVIKRNKSRKDKDLVTDREDGPPLQLVDAPSEDEEAVRVAQCVERWVQQGTTPREIAVFYRTNACSRALEAALTRSQLPYQVVGGLSFFERREVKDLLAYARLVVNPRDEVSALRVVNTPPRGIGQTSIGRIRAAAQEHDESVLQVLRREEVHSALRGPAKKGAMSFLRIVGDIADQAASAERVLQTAIDKTGYRRFADSLNVTEDVDRGENIDELLAFAAEYDEREDGGIRGFLEEISLLTDLDRWENEAERISLMTVHAAKGLEFDRVAVVGLEEGLFPHARSFEEAEGMEEERRLFYVALTRAREELCLSHSRMRFRTGAPGPQAPSRFLDELPGEVLPDVHYADELAEQKFEPRSAAQAATEPEEEELRPGDLVRHRVFGEGTVQRVLGSGINQRLVVLFDDSGQERTLLSAYAMLEKII